MQRRQSIKQLISLTTVGLAANSSLLSFHSTYAKKFNISLAEWSLHKSIFGKKMDHLDFAQVASELGFEAIEYVNQMFIDKAEDQSYLDMMNQKAEEAGVKQLLIMIDREGYLGDTDTEKRIESVEKHYKWVKAAKHLGCHSIRVNAFGKGTPSEVMTAAVDGLGRLSSYAAEYDINVIVENHGSYSSDGSWIAEVMTKVGMENCGTLPDFGNFCIKREGGATWGAPCVEEYDKYKGVKEMMPFAKSVSAKAMGFKENGDEITIDYDRMMDIVLSHGFSGYVGIEYEGDDLSEKEGILATKKLLERYQ